MSGEQQLERSVLENKERDELHAIADAMGLKPGARTKKADLVDNILRATGVDVGDPGPNGSGPSGDAEAKPRRGRATRARAVESAVTEVTAESDGDGTGPAAKGAKGRGTDDSGATTAGSDDPSGARAGTEGTETQSKQSTGGDAVRPGPGVGRTLDPLVSGTRASEAV